jgi:hypothetical protein
VGALLEELMSGLALSACQCMTMCKTRAKQKSPKKGFLHRFCQFPDTPGWGN